MNEQLGTPQYAAPVDMWSVGVVLFNMVKGTQPFCNGDIDSVKEQVIHKEINFTGFKNNELKELCKGLLERDPNQRLSAFQAFSALKLIGKDENTITATFIPDIHKIMNVLYNDRAIIEELKNIFLSECTPEELYSMFEEILS